MEVLLHQTDGKSVLNGWPSAHSTRGVEGRGEGDPPEASPAGATGASALAVAVWIGAVGEQGLGTRLLPEMLEAAAAADHVRHALNALRQIRVWRNYFAFET